MKAMTIEVPREGASVQLVLRGGMSPAQVVIVAADEVDIRYGNPGLEPAAVAAPAAANAKTAEKPSGDLDEISASLLKLRPRKRAAAVNVIRTMFQFTNPITAETANKILEDLRRRGYLTITPGGVVEFPNQKESAAAE